ncbi:hypothetical protein [Dellaglioa carnosa]|uniref:hypothetical protein n=1 Tax=Dellaglioa carnosa TaxID=2995136 RepID=UPI0022A83942|nr:hypothetical protein [Dellaglioa carnosa]MCZ2492474.1 hypothetical protein [Dellaglioa carnosa]
MGETNTFGELDSWACWKNEDKIQGSTATEWESSLKEANKVYESKEVIGFPIDEHPLSKLPTDLSEVDYVLVGMNPGNAAGKKTDDGKKVNIQKYPNNFHGEKKSNDYKLQVAVHKTPVMGAFMTDASDTIESTSKLVSMDIENKNKTIIDILFERLDHLNVKSSAKIIFMGPSKFRSVLNKQFNKEIKKSNKLTKLHKRNVGALIYPEYNLINPNYMTSTTIKKRIIKINKSKNSEKEKIAKKLLIPTFEPINTYIDNPEHEIKNEHPLVIKGHKVYLIKHYSGASTYFDVEEVHAILNLITED